MEDMRRGGGAKKAARRMSWTGPSRRAIANKADLCNSDHMPSSSSIPNPSAVALDAAEVENGAITYTANLLGNRPRIMDVCIPKLSEDGRVCDEWSEDRDGAPPAIRSSGGANTMLDLFKTIQQGLQNLDDPADLDEEDTMPPNDNASAAVPGDGHGLMILQNRPPWWNIELGAFVLNFGGRVKVASVKNFQLCERHDQGHIMQFGRIEGRHNFTMDFQHPLTPMQAFAIAISSLQSKISFG